MSVPVNCNFAHIAILYLSLKNKAFSLLIIINQCHLPTQFYNHRQIHYHNHHQNCHGRYDILIKQNHLSYYSHHVCKSIYFEKSRPKIFQSKEIRREKDSYSVSTLITTYITDKPLLEHLFSLQITVDFQKSKFHSHVKSTPLTTHLKSGNLNVLWIG